jgi:nucleoid-associated protein YgaU
MKKNESQSLSLLIKAGALAAIIASSVTAAGAPAAPAAAPAVAPEAVRAQAREIFAHIVGIESSIGKGKVPLVASYLAERFKAGGFPAADIHVLSLGETASLVVRYRGKGGGGRPIAFIAHMDVVTAKRSDWQRDPYRPRHLGCQTGGGAADRDLPAPQGRGLRADSRSHHRVQRR